MSALAPAATLPARFRDRFVVRQLLGTGGNAVVVDAIDKHTGHEVALKVLHRQPVSGPLLREEFRTVRQISHRNLVQLFELFEDGKDACFTMERVDGLDLLAHLHRAKDDNVAGWRSAVFRAFVQLQDGLEHLHACNVVHGDVKPSNVRVSPDGRVVLLDFGLARPFDVAVAAPTGGPQPLRIAGTLPYLAPELMTGAPPHPGSDYYALGVMLYRVLANRWPHWAESVALWHDAKLQHAPPLPANAVVPRAWAELAQALLHPDARQRPSASAVRLAFSAGELAQNEQVRALPGTASAWQETVHSIGPTDGAAHPQPPTPLPAPQHTTPGTLFGRDAELGRLRQALHRAATGKVQVVVVQGRAGIGKSALVAALCQEARHVAGALVLTGRCRQEEHIAFSGVEELIGALLQTTQQLAPAEAARVVPEQASALAVLFPWLADQVGIGGPPDQAERSATSQHIWSRAQAAIALWLARMAERRPVVLVLDDVQWDDADGAHLLRAVLEGDQRCSLLLVVACRSEESANSHVLQLLDQAPAPAAAAREVITLDRLAPPACRSVLAAAGIADSSPQALAVLPLAEGNPAWLHKLGRLALGQATSNATLREQLLAAIDQLSAPQQALLALLAVAGRPLQVAELAAALPQWAGEVAVALSALQNHGWLRLGAPDATQLLWIDAPLVVDIVRTRCSAAQVRQLHLALVQHLRATPGADGRHILLHAVGAGALAGAGNLAYQLAEEAAAAMALHQAAWLFGMAIDLGVDSRPLWTVLQRWAEVLQASGRPAAAADRWQQAAQALSGIDAGRHRHFVLRAAAARLVAGKVFAAASAVQQHLPPAGAAPTAGWVAHAKRWLRASAQPGSGADHAADAEGAAICALVIALTQPNALAALLHATQHRQPERAEGAANAIHRLAWQAWQHLHAGAAQSTTALALLAKADALATQLPGGDPLLTVVAVRATLLLGSPLAAAYAMRKDIARMGTRMGGGDQPPADPVADIAQDWLVATLCATLADLGAHAELAPLLASVDHAAQRQGRVLAATLALPAFALHAVVTDTVPSTAPLVHRAAAAAFGATLEHGVQWSQALLQAYAGDWHGAWQRLQRWQGPTADQALALPEHGLRYWDLRARLALATLCPGHPAFGALGGDGALAVDAALVRLRRCPHPWAAHCVAELTASRLADSAERATALFAAARQWHLCGARWRGELAWAVAARLQPAVLPPVAQPFAGLAASGVANPARFAALWLPVAGAG